MTNVKTLAMELPPLISMTNLGAWRTAVLTRARLAADRVKPGFFFDKTDKVEVEVVFYLRRAAVCPELRSARASLTLGIPRPGLTLT